MSNPLVKPKRAIQRGANPLRRPARQVRKPGTLNSTNQPGAGSSLAASKSLLNGAKKPTVPANQIAAEYKLHACNGEDIKDLRYHLMRFHTPSKKPVDPVKDFTKPIRLHRKDPRNMQNQLTLSELEERNRRLGITTAIPKHILQEAALAEAKAAEEEESEEPVDDIKETVEESNGNAANGGSKEESAKKGKVAPEEADMSLIAPDGGARRNKQNLFQKKTRQVMVGDPSARRIRYEEFYPWVMEDFDGQNTWVGNYEAGQMGQYVLFVFDKDGFKMVPAERWYKMTPRNKYATLTLEEVEKHMDSRDQPDRWVMKYFGNEEGEEGRKRPLNARRRFRATDVSQEDNGIRRDDDGNEIDFDDEFADDEEAPIMDGAEEDVKEVERKIKKEHQAAKFTNLFDEDNDEEDEEAQKVDKQGRNIIKSLRSLEKNINYSDDDDSNPYASDESSDYEELDNATGLGNGANDGKDPDIKKEPGTENDNEDPSAAGQAGDKKDRKLKDKKLKKEKKKKNAKKHHDLPRGMVILNLPSSRLSQFPENSWNPGLKRRRAESESDEAGQDSRGPKAKKIKIKVSKDETTTSALSENGTAVPVAKAAVPAPVAVKPEPVIKTEPGTESTKARSVSPSASKAGSTGSDATTTDVADLLQEEEVANIIRSNRLTAKELLAELKHRIKKRPENLTRLKTFVKKVAKLHEGHLVLREK